MLGSLESGPPTAGFLFMRQHGAVNWVAVDATAFPHRDRSFQLALILDGAEARAGSAGLRWKDDLGTALAPYRRGAYANTLPAGRGNEEAAYGPNLQRLRRVKTRYDPENVFDQNVNVAPA